MDNDRENPYPSFFEQDEELPPIEEHIATGFVSPKKSHEQKTLDTGSIPSFYDSAFDLED